MHSQVVLGRALLEMEAWGRVNSTGCRKCVYACVRVCVCVYVCARGWFRFRVQGAMSWGALQASHSRGQAAAAGERQLPAETFRT